MENFNSLDFPRIITPEREKQQKENEAKYEIYIDFVRSHPDLSFTQEIKLYQARLLSKTADEFQTMLDEFEEKKN